MSTSEPCTIDSLNDKTVIAFVSLNGISGATSIISSSLLIYMLLSKKRQRLRRLQNRFLLAMSIIDVMYSAALGLSVVPIPKGECSLGFGNISTCTAQGFFIQFGLAVPGYVAMISLSCFLSIVCNIRQTRISRFCEVAMHAYAVLPMLGVAIVAASQKNFYSNRFQCWIDRAEGVEDVGGLKAYGKSEWVGIATTIWLPLNAFIIFVCLIAVVRKTRKRAQKMRSYEFQPTTSTTQLTRRSLAKRKRSAIEVSADDSAKQVILYICAFVITYVWDAMYYLVNNGHSDVLYILSSVFLPLQGFWNFIIYIRPRIVVIRREQEGLSFLSALKKVIFGDNDQSNSQQNPLRRRLTMTKKKNLHVLIPAEDSGKNNSDCSKEDYSDYENEEDTMAFKHDIEGNDVPVQNTWEECSHGSITAQELAAIKKCAAVFR